MSKTDLSPPLVAGEKTFSELARGEDFFLERKMIQSGLL